MKVETGFVDGKKRKEEVLANGEKIVRKKVFRKRRVQVPFIQRLFQTCKAVFKGPGTVPCPDDVQTLQHLLDKMKAEDVGLSKELSFFRAASDVGTPRITCTTIYECDNFSMCIFFMPASAIIPLHNHPGMTVFSKLLLGSMHIKSYDWVEPTKLDETNSSSSKLRLARLEADSRFTAPCNTSVLYPTTGGNIHTFTAITPCAVLDVLGPPYSTEDGRDCTYYRDHPCSSTFSDVDTVDRLPGEVTERFGWLEEIDVPQDLKMFAVEYLGPQIIDN